MNCTARTLRLFAAFLVVITGFWTVSFAQTKRVSYVAHSGTECSKESNCEPKCSAHGDKNCSSYYCYDCRAYHYNCENEHCGVEGHHRHENCGHADYCREGNCHEGYHAHGGSNCNDHTHYSSSNCDDCNGYVNGIKYRDTHCDNCGEDDGCTVKYKGNKVKVKCNSCNGKWKYYQQYRRPEGYYIYDRDNRVLTSYED